MTEYILSELTNITFAIGTGATGFGLLLTYLERQKPFELRSVDDVPILIVGGLVFLAGSAVLATCTLLAPAFPG